MGEVKVESYETRMVRHVLSSKDIHGGDACSLRGDSRTMFELVDRLAAVVEDIHDEYEGAQVALRIVGSTLNVVVNPAEEA